MTALERRNRKRYWLRLIKKWQQEPIDRSCGQLSTLDDPDYTSEILTHLTVTERLEHLMRLRWMNYGPDALYGRLERVYTIGELAPASVPRRRRRSDGATRPRSRHR